MPRPPQVTITAPDGTTLCVGLPLQAAIARHRELATPLKTLWRAHVLGGEPRVTTARQLPCGHRIAITTPEPTAGELAEQLELASLSDSLAEVRDAKQSYSRAPMATYTRTQRRELAALLREVRANEDDLVAVARADARQARETLTQVDAVVMTPELRAELRRLLDEDGEVAPDRLAEVN